MIGLIKNNFKNSWLLAAFLIVSLILWNTNLLFETLKNEERKKMKLWALAQEELIENSVVNNLTFEVLQQTWINPMIQVDQNEKIIGYKNINWDENSQDSLELYNYLENIKSENQPILIRYKDSLSDINQKLYYGDSILLKKLQYYPLALLLIIFLFGAVLYFVYKTSRISEQNRLWNSMAKETAHQIGTPLTSMIGWITLMKDQNKESEPLNEIEKDLERLKVITDRFSKMGFLPKLKKSDIVSETKKTIEYLKKRSSDLVIFQTNISKNEILLPLNQQLYSWTLENLIKNGIDAIKGKGTIKVSLKEDLNWVIITISDSGQGIKKELYKKIFSPGYTSKKRGWGLGLSLAKRIISDYHKGKISVKKSVIGKGSTFEILLKKNH
ncbi:MAG: HAMP domain-containing sensor histidine kinase [Bacteroidota bacterium]|nr:HAMP domain-containing sensor histidine kinase [Bacteroidota bacterium]